MEIQSSQNLLSTHKTFFDCPMRRLLNVAVLLGLLFGGGDCVPDLLSVPTNEITVSSQLQNGQPIPLTPSFRVVPEETEDVGISLDPPTKSISISPSIASPGQEVKFVLEDKDELMKQGQFEFMVTALGLISGDEQKFPLKFSMTADGESSEGVSGPKFEKPLYTLTLETGLAENELAVLKLTNTAEEASQFTYEIEGDEMERFRVSSQGNSVFIHSKPCPHCKKIVPSEMSLIVTAKGNGGEDSTLLLFRNDKSLSPLHFTRPIFETSLVEGSSTFSRLVKLDSINSDHKPILYTLQDSSGLFALHPKTGILSIQHPEFLMAEIFGSQLNLTATVTDGKNTDSAIISIDIIGKGELGESPKFKQEEYSFSVSPLSRRVGQIDLLVPVKDTKYSIAEGNGELFAIDEKNGELQYTGTVEKDTYNYTLKITAESGSGQPLVDITTVTITVKGIESYPPVFNTNVSSVINLNKDSASGVAVYTVVATDRDNGAKLQYSVDSVQGVDMIGQIDTLNKQSLFTFASEGRDNGVLILKESLKKMDYVSLLITVSVQDLSHLNEPKDYANLTIILQSDHKKPDTRTRVQINPISATISLSENVPIGTYVYTMTTQPRIIEEIPQKFTYALMEMDDEKKKMFMIDAKTGVISTNGSLRGMNDTSLTVLISHPISASTNSVQLNIHIVAAKDVGPKFNKLQYTTTIKENVPIGSEVIRMEAEDADHNEIMNFQLQGTDAARFTIDQKGIVRTGTELDHEDIKNVHLFVKGSDESGRAAVVPLTVNIDNENDSVPDFEQKEYSIKVMENLPINSYIIQVKAHDADGDKLEYSIGMGKEGEKLQSLLDIDVDGRITNREQLDGLEGSYPLSVTVSDGVHSTSVDVMLSILPTYKCMPSFDPKMPKIFTIKENQPEDSIIGKLSAIPLDAKCSLMYTLWEPRTNKYVNQTTEIRVDPASGSLHAMESFDFETKQRIPLIIALQSGSIYTQMAVEVQVIDEDDNPIVFDMDTVKFEVSEDIAVNKTIGKVHANDKDSINKVYYHLITKDEHFNLDMETGLITLVKTLDREKNDVHQLDISASNSKDPMDKDAAHSVASINILVRDVNDNGPLFDQSSYVILLDKSTLPGEILLEVKAEDPDVVVDDEGGVFYRITSSIFDYHGMTRDVDNHFTINSTNGQLKLEQSIKDFIGGVFLVKIGSSDGKNGSGHTDSTVAKMFVYDENDVVVLELPENPLNVTPSRLHKISSILSNTTGLEAHVLSVQYHQMEGRLVREISDVQMVFINPNTMEVVPSEKTIAIVDTKGWTDNELAPAIRQLNGESSSILSSSLFSPLLILASIFALLLLLVLVVFTVLLCYYRWRFLREKRVFEDEQILAGALNRPKRHLQPTPILEAPIERLQERNHSPSQFNPSQYTVQELNMTVESEAEYAKKNQIYDSL